MIKEFIINGKKVKVRVFSPDLLTSSIARLYEHLYGNLYIFKENNEIIAWGIPV